MYAVSSGIIPLDAPTLTTPRKYIAVRLTTDPLDPAQVATAFRTLHGQGADATPTIDMLLMTAGDADGVAYLFGGDAIDTARLERTLRRCVPPSDEYTQRTTTIADLLTAESTPEATTDTDTHVPGLTDRSPASNCGLARIAGVTGRPSSGRSTRFGPRSEPAGR